MANKYSHSTRLEDMSKAQADVFANENPLEQRLKDSIAKIVQNIGDLQTLQTRNEALHGENAKLEQQVENINERVEGLLKEKESLSSTKSSLEEQVKKSAEELAGLRERLMNVVHAPNIQEALQIGILQTENFNLKQEAQQLRQAHEQYDSTRKELLQQIESLKVFIIGGPH
jgi:predicted nuclease with TOPRIM domain